MKSVVARSAGRGADDAHGGSLDHEIPCIQLYGQRSQCGGQEYVATGEESQRKIMF